MTTSNESAQPKNGATEKIQIEQHSFAGMLWFMGWLFTIGYVQLPLGRGVLALLLWPYYLGTAFGPGLPPLAGG